MWGGGKIKIMLNNEFETTLDTMCQCIYEKNQSLKALRNVLKEKENEIASLKAQLEVQMSTLNSKIIAIKEKDKTIEYYSNQTERHLEQIQQLLKENSKYKELKKANEEVKKVMEEIAGGKND